MSLCSIGRVAIHHYQHSRFDDSKDLIIALDSYLATLHTISGSM
jgi:hypothetical protein